MKPEGYQEAIFEAKPVEKVAVPMVVTVSRSVLLAAIRANGINVPADAEVTFYVPGGGDYSSTAVELNDKEQVVSVRWKE
jgi:hypothetical protein